MIFFVLLIASALGARSIGQAGLDLIKEFEGCVLTAYWDPWGEVWTIGYGTSEYVEDIIGADIYEGLTITEETASYWLELSVNANFAPNVNKWMSTYNFNQNQFDALVSFAYNIGSIDELVGWGSKSISEISNDFLLYVWAGGEILPGLERRRAAEKALFDTPDGGDNGGNGGNDNAGGDATVWENGVATVTTNAINVRAAPSTGSEIVADYAQGDTFYYDSWVKNSECTWCSYIGGSGNRRYVCGKTASGECYLSPCPNL